MPDPQPLHSAPACPLEALVTQTFRTWSEAEAWLATLTPFRTGRVIEGLRMHELAMGKGGVIARAYIWMIPILPPEREHSHHDRRGTS